MLSVLPHLPCGASSTASMQGVVPQPAGAVDSTQAADDDDEDGDLFAEDDDADARVGEMAIDGAAEAPVHDDRRDARQAEGFRKANTGLSDMYDDSQGYYNFRVGELMGSRCALVNVLWVVGGLNIAAFFAAAPQLDSGCTHDAVVESAMWSYKRPHGVPHPFACV